MPRYWCTDATAKRQCLLSNPTYNYARQVWLLYSNSLATPQEDEQSRTMNISQYTLLIFILLLLFGTISFRYSRGARSFRRCFKFDILGIMFPVLILTNFRTSTLLTRLGDLFYIYSGTFVTRIIGRDYVFTCDAQNIHHIMNAEFESFVVGAERTHLFGSLSSQGVLTLDGLAWRSVRGQLRRQFSRHKEMVDLNMHETHVERLLEKLRRSNGMPIDLSEPLSSFAQESHSEFVLGQPRSENGMRRRLNFIEALNYAAETIAIKGFCGPLHHAVRRGGFKHACTLIHRHIESITVSLRANRNRVGIKGPSYCFAQSLASDESSPTTLRDQVVDVLLAGGDTLGTVLASTMWLLASNEYVYQKLREDVINHCGFQPPSYDDLKTIRYLRFVLYEGT